MSLAGRIVQATIKIHSEAQMRAGLTQLTELAIGTRDAAMGNRGTRPFTQPVRSGQRDTLGGDKTVPVTSPMQEINQSPGNLPCVKVQASVGRCRDRGLQALPLDFEPGQRLIGILKGLWLDRKSVV